MSPIQKAESAVIDQSFGQPSRGTIVLGVAASDPHVVANHLIAMYLRHQNYKVINLGACTPTQDFMKVASEVADLKAILIGSLNGHARADLSDLPTWRAYYKISAPVLVGGNLSVGAIKTDQVIQDLHALGVDVVLRHPKEITQALSHMKPALLPWQMKTRLHAENFN